MQVAHEIQSTKSAQKCEYFCVKNFINQRDDINVCGVAAVFSAITIDYFTIATKIIGKRKVSCCRAWMNNLESYSSFARKLLITQYIDGGN